MLGKQVELYPDIVKRQYEEGHFLGNHTYSHNNSKIFSSINSFLSEIKKTDILIGKAIGNENFSSHVFRFPNGSTSKLYYHQKQEMIKQLDDIDYVYVDWNALNHDSVQKYSKAQLLKNLEKSMKGKDTVVILMHDSGDVNNTYDILEDSIEFLKKEGYVFKTFYDLIE